MTEEASGSGSLAGYDIQDKIILVTGSNRGIGLAFVKYFVTHGASKVYAGVRNMETAKVFEGDTKVTPLLIDLSKQESIKDAASIATDVHIVINNGAVLSRTDPFAQDAVANLQNEINVNVFGLMYMAQQFAPILEKNGGGAFVQINSVASLRCGFPTVSTYSASKAAAYSMTQAIRQTLAPKGTRVLSVHPGPIATEMILAVDPELGKISEDPMNVAAAVAQALKDGTPFLVYPDSKSRQLGQLYENFAKEAIEKGNLYG